MAIKGPLNILASCLTNILYDVVVSLFVIFNMATAQQAPSARAIRISFLLRCSYLPERGDLHAMRVSAAADTQSRCTCGWHGSAFRAEMCTDFAVRRIPKYPVLEPCTGIFDRNIKQLLRKRERRLTGASGNRRLAAAASWTSVQSAYFYP